MALPRVSVFILTPDRGQHQCRPSRIMPGTRICRIPLPVQYRIRTKYTMDGMPEASGVTTKRDVNVYHPKLGEAGREKVCAEAQGGNFSTPEH